MKVRKHYEDGHVFVYVTEDDMETCLTFDDEQQMRRLGECLTDLARIGGGVVEIKKRD